MNRSKRLLALAVNNKTKIVDGVKVMPMYVRNETKCVNDDYLYGFPADINLSDCDWKKDQSQKVLNTEENAVSTSANQPNSLYENFEELDENWDPWLNFKKWQTDNAQNKHVKETELENLPKNMEKIEISISDPSNQTAILTTKLQNTPNISQEPSRDGKCLTGILQEHIMNENQSEKSATDIYENSSESWVPDTDDELEARSAQSEPLESIMPSPHSLTFQKDKSNEKKLINNTNIKKKITILENTVIKEGTQKEQFNNAVDNKRVEFSLRKGNVWDKRDRCPYCHTDVTNFSRHLFRKHADEESVKKILSCPKGDRNRKCMIDLIRKQGNFSVLDDTNVVRPVQRPSANAKNMTKSDDFLPCKYCKGLYKIGSLKRHAKHCLFNGEKKAKLKYASEGQTMIAFKESRQPFLDRLRLKSEVFHTMQADRISLICKSDSLICQYAEDYLRKHKRPHIRNAVSNKMRELGRLLIPLQDIYGINDMLQALNPENYDKVVAAARIISGYDEATRTFKAPSLALHMRTSLLAVGAAAKHLLLKKDPVLPVVNYEEHLKNIKRFMELVATNWKYAMGSLALKDLNEKHSTKPQTLPVTQDIILFQKYTHGFAEKNMENLKLNCEDVQSFKNLTEATLALTILLNRKRVGDVQYTKLEAYNLDVINTTQEECLNVLTESEKLLSTHFKRIVTTGKGSKSVPILFSKKLQEYVDTLLSIRNKTNLVPKENPFLFALTGSSEKWVDGSSALRKFATNCGAANPNSLTSSRLRKQIATVLQILNLDEAEMEQMATFMGHTKKTHEEFYRLPQDVFQTGKIAKLLLMMEKGVGAENKGRTLSDIDLELEKWSRDESLNEGSSNMVADCEIPAEQSDDDISEKSAEDISVPKKNVKKPKKDLKKPCRGSWNAKQKSVMLTYFKNNIKKKIVPKKEECMKLITENPNLFSEKTWVQVKVFIYNSYRSK